MITKDSSMRADVLAFWDATIFCNNFARWLQRIVVTCDVLVFWYAMIFCNNFARWLQKIVACELMSRFFWDATILARLFCNKCMPPVPKRGFYKSEQKMGRVFSMHFQPFLAQIEYSHAWKVPWKDTTDLLFRLSCGATFALRDDVHDFLRS